MHWPCLLQVGDSEVVQEEEEAEKQPGRIKKTYVFRFFSPGMGIVCEKMQISAAVKLTFYGEKKNCGEEKLVVQKKSTK